MNLPLVQLVRQIAPQPRVADVVAETRRQWLASKTAKRIKPGMRIAVGCGSRGIKNFLPIAKATVDASRNSARSRSSSRRWARTAGRRPKGQRELLASYDIDEAHLGVPVVTDMDAVNIGTNSWGEPVWWDKNALAADGVVTVSRVKPHTDFRGPFESGILKMLVIGLGKRHGADQVHSFGTRGLRDMLPESAKVILEKTPFIGGLAILENANEETAKLEVVDRDDLFDREPELLEQARKMMGRLPFEELDVLVIGECGKNYSRGRDRPERRRPDADRGDARSRDERPADHPHRGAGRVAGEPRQRHRHRHRRPHHHAGLNSIDPVPFRMNNLTARSLWRSKLPFAFETDREVIEKCIETCWQPEFEKVKFCVIPNTLEVAEMWVSAPLAAEAKAIPHLELVGTPQPLPFDARGNLVQEKLFPHSVRGRRKSNGH